MWSKLKAYAQPFSESINEVLERVKSGASTLFTYLVVYPSAFVFAHLRANIDVLQIAAKSVGSAMLFSPVFYAFLSIESLLIQLVEKPLRITIGHLLGVSTVASSTFAMVIFGGLAVISAMGLAQSYLSNKGRVASADLKAIFEINFVFTGFHAAFYGLPSTFVPLGSSLINVPLYPLLGIMAISAVWMFEDHYYHRIWGKDKANEHRLHQETMEWLATRQDKKNTPEKTPEKTIEKDVDKPESHDSSQDNSQENATGLTSSKEIVHEAPGRRLARK